MKKLTLLHSNDLHGDFLAEKAGGRLVGGVSRLSGYVSKVRREEPAVLYAVAGDMLQGSLIDSEYRGLSTIEIMNLLAPDVVTIGNHEADYGLAHLLLLEKCARFPVICANLCVKATGRRLFRGHRIVKAGGVKVLFIGITTAEVLEMTKLEKLVGTLIDVRDPVAEVGRVCDAYRTEDVDLTMLLTHVGIDADKRIAAALDPRWGVDLILGGHSHTLMEQPVVVNGIPIAQAACGTDQVGRFDITVDSARNRVAGWSWELVPVDDSRCPEDRALRELIGRYRDETESRYARVMTRFSAAYTHPARNRETELGKIFADAFRESLGLDVMLEASGSIRRPSLGPIVTLRDLREAHPFNEAVFRVIATGAQLRRMLGRMLRDEALEPGAHTEFYQLSRGLRAVYDRASRRVTSLTLEGRELGEGETLRVGLHKYHFTNLESNLGVGLAELAANGAPLEVATQSDSVLDEYFSLHPLVEAPPEARLVITGGDG